VDGRPADRRLLGPDRLQHAGLQGLKFGYYNWSSFGSSRKVLLRSPILVQDPTGGTYSPDSLRAHMQGL
jgi:hypothetical protein